MNELIPGRTRLTRIEEDESVRTNQVDTASSGFATQQEDEFLPLGIVELIDELLTLVDGHSSVKSEVSISAYANH